MPVENLWNRRREALFTMGSAGTALYELIRFSPQGADTALTKGVEGLVLGGAVAFTPFWSNSYRMARNSFNRFRQNRMRIEDWLRFVPLGTMMGLGYELQQFVRESNLPAPHANYLSRTLVEAPLEGTLPMLIPLLLVQGQRHDVYGRAGRGLRRGGELIRKYAPRVGRRIRQAGNYTAQGLGCAASSVAEGIYEAGRHTVQDIGHGANSVATGYYNINRRLYDFVYQKTGPSLGGKIVATKALIGANAAAGGAVYGAGRLANLW